MRKIYFFGTGMVLLGLAIWGVFTIYRPHRNTANDRPEATLAARDLYEQFRANEEEASRKWVGKVVGIQGIISSVADAGNYISVNISGSADGGINCSLLKKDLDPSDRFQSGENIQIKGKCTGYLMDVNLVDCVVVKQ